MRGRHGCLLVTGLDLALTHPKPLLAAGPPDCAPYYLESCPFTATASSIAAELAACRWPPTVTRGRPVHPCLSGLRRRRLELGHLVANPLVGGFAITLHCDSPDHWRTAHHRSRQVAQSVIVGALSLEAGIPEPDHRRSPKMV